MSNDEYKIVIKADSRAFRLAQINHIDLIGEKSNELKESINTQVATVYVLGYLANAIEKASGE